MPVPVTMPKLGETVVDGTVARWHKQPGDPVEKMEPLLDISTDKIDTEVPAPVAGILLEILVNEGTTVETGEVLALIEGAGSSGESEEAGEPGSSAPPSSVHRPPSPEEESKETGETGPNESPSSIVGRRSSTSRPQGREYISPVVARMAAEHDLDLDQIDGTGLHGRITKKDVKAYLANRATPRPDPQSPPPSPHPLASDQTLQPLSAMRRAIAQHMSQSVKTAPHAVTIHEADMTAVVRHREAHKASFARKGIRLTFTPYFVAAVAQALAEHPVVNGRFSEKGLILNRRVHVGVAVSLEGSPKAEQAEASANGSSLSIDRPMDGGLLVPVIRDADERNLMGLARAVNELTQAARQGTLSPDDLKGGTFTVTNHGVTNSLLATPIINQPQSGILGVGAITKRVVVRSGESGLLPSADDAIVIRPMCYLSFAFDHRALDGAEADRFVQTVVTLLEEWGTDTL